MGTPEFAVAPLQALHEADINILAVITAPDKPAGRGLSLQASPVKEAALLLGLPVLQPEKLKDPDFQNQLKELNPDLGIVVAFRMLPESVWSLPRYGTFNLHASLLPKYRGAAPIPWAIINGEKETGVTTFFLKHEIDTGDLLYQEKTIIEAEDNGETLYQKLMQQGAQLVVKTTHAIFEKSITPFPQPSIPDLPIAPKIFKETCEINWNQPAQRVYDFIRALSPYPGAWTQHEGKIYKLFSAQISNENVSPGEWRVSKNELLVGTNDFALSIISIQAPSKKRMEIADFLRGNSI
jgi:methionyl-tRNA formyltransferase